MASLLEFYKDSESRENVKKYLLEFLRSKAIERVMAGEPTAGIKDANDTITEAFEHLDIMFKAPSKKVIHDSAR